MDKVANLNNSDEERVNDDHALDEVVSLLNPNSSLANYSDKV